MLSSTIFRAKSSHSRKTLSRTILRRISLLITISISYLIRIQKANKVNKVSKVPKRTSIHKLRMKMLNKKLIKMDKIKSKSLKLYPNHQYSVLNQSSFQYKENDLSKYFIIFIIL